MSTDRWYPTVLTLGDESGPTGRSGRVLVASGKLGGRYGAKHRPLLGGDRLVHFGVGNGPRKDVRPDVSQPPPPARRRDLLYADGIRRLQHASVYSLSDRASYFTFSSAGGTAGAWTDVGTAMNRTKGMSALVLQPSYPFVRVIVVGGGDSFTRTTAQLINLSTLSPSWGVPTAIADGRAHVNVNVVLLPDGKVFLCGGLETPPYTCYRYDPSAVATPWAELDELGPRATTTPPRCSSPAGR
jgi:hypothetical protein